MTPEETDFLEHLQTTLWAGLLNTMRNLGLPYDERARIVHGVRSIFRDCGAQDSPAPRDMDAEQLKDFGDGLIEFVVDAMRSTKH